MYRSESTGRQLARVQRLCCLGVGGRLALPQLLRELGRLVPSSAQIFYRAGPKLELTHLCSGYPPTAALQALHLGELHERREREFVHMFSECMHRNYDTPVGDLLDLLLKVERRDYYRSDLFNEISRSLGRGHGLDVRITGLGRKLGNLQV